MNNITINEVNLISITFVVNALLLAGFWAVGIKAGSWRKGSEIIAAMFLLFCAVVHAVLFTYIVRVFA